MAAMALPGTWSRPGAPDSRDGTAEERSSLHQLTESPGFSRNYYFCSAQSEIRGMRKEGIEGARCFPALKKDVLMDMDPECGGSLVVVTLEEGTAEVLVRQIDTGWEFA